MGDQNKHVFRAKIAGRELLGLAHVSFTVSPTATLGADTIAIASGTATSLSDENGNAIPFAISNGSITVPEPWRWRRPQPRR